MRLWSIHPAYLDWKGLGANWREALLAQAVVQGKTKGWRNHPQLNRFKAHEDPERPSDSSFSRTTRRRRGGGTTTTSRRS
ncbi:hypothetical protein HQ586_01600 [Candidatus Bathyarchaeota archaeon]|nr:hypothetical protein [Candidatus Bathyarchaeota archaeon]